MRLAWTDCTNARDLGGLPTMDGGRIRAGALLRSDRLGPAAVPAIRAAGVSRVLDLRWSRECASLPSPFADDQLYVHVPLLADVRVYEIPPDSYAPMLDHNAARIGAAFRALADAPPGGVVVHCTVGRDRTGALIALVLAVAGVDDAAIVDDYALTADSAPVAMRNTLGHLRDAYGGATAYLLAAGVTRAQVAAVRDRLVTR